MTYLSQELLLLEADFQIKIRQAMIESALNVVGETPSGNTDKDTKRKTLGVAILNTPGSHEIEFRRAVAALGTITSASSDASVKTAIDSVFSDIAGVKGV